MTMLVTPDGSIPTPLRFETRQTTWSNLLAHDAPGTRDRRGAAANMVKLGLHPIALHGIAESGGCTCH
ncbi:MAG TPA: hypothetical protein VG963_33985, partial [Polyangiaceae bacterium]|nr:hypothetical protein [Polyangiaceae bacterium]